ncbi:hypothetical protein SAY86_013104 [Trapa natans]|uniref:Expansin n=1 Tax=Trapa natans TaxID=22666 RepID=A0AAN7RBC0_TRANT|nr:hypothetical protein SAY86_013104 [Trapa natans]
MEQRRELHRPRLWRFFMFLFIVCNILERGFDVGGAESWVQGHASFYGAYQSPSTLGGACGYDNTFHAGFGVHTAALSAALSRAGEACGSCYEVRCDFGADPRWCLRTASVAVTATNFCPPNNNGGWCDPPRRHLDMSVAAFMKIARQGNEGIVPILYRRVSCRRIGGVHFTLKGHSNFHMVLISNVGGGGDLKAVSVRGSRARTWAAINRNWGANWQSSIDLRGQGLSFRLTLVDGRTMDFFNVIPASWAFGQTYSSPRQFP